MTEKYLFGHVNKPPNDNSYFITAIFLFFTSPVPVGTRGLLTKIEWQDLTTNYQLVTLKQ